MTAEFLIRIELTAPPGIDPQVLQGLRQKEALRARQLAASGNLIRLWRAQTDWGNWGLWSCRSRDDLEHLLDSLPLRPFMSIEIHELSPHPSDPLGNRKQEEGHRDA